LKVLDKGIKKKVQIGKRANYTKGSPCKRMEKALVTLRDSANKKSLNEVAQENAIDYKALRLRFKGTLNEKSHQGKASALTTEQEAALKKHILFLAEVGYGVDNIIVREIARKFPTISKFIASDGWLEGFMARNPDLARRKAEGLDISRIKSITTENVNTYFQFLKNVLALGKIFFFSNLNYSKSKSFLMEKIFLRTKSLTWMR
jgi:hypothetical protein